MMRIREALIYLVALSLATISAQADDIYHWVDEDGVMHFSDDRPAHHDDVQTLKLRKTNPANYDPTEDPYSVQNQADRMNQTWAALEKKRDERREARQEQARQNPPQPRYDDPFRYNDYYYTRPWYGLRPGYPHRPTPLPGQRPTIQSQINTLDELGLSGPQPHSINSSAHHRRVQNSRSFLDLARPGPRN